MIWKIELYANGCEVWLTGLAGGRELFLGLKDELTLEEWADVRLIAAAPELLEVCGAIIEAREIALLSGLSGKDYTPLCEAMEGAQKAIAKVENAKANPA